MKHKSIPFSCLLLIAFTGIALGQSSRDYAAIEMVNRLKGTFTRDETRADKPIVAVNLHSTAVMDDDLAALSALKHLRTLDLRLTKIGDAGVHHLRDLKELVFLNIFRTNTTDRGLEDVNRLKRLETLLAGGTRITDAGLKRLSGLKKLRKISVFDTAVGDTGILSLRDLKELRVVLVGRSKVTEDGQRRLRAALPSVSFSELM
jgi:hypothetical protein